MKLFKTFILLMGLFIFFWYGFSNLLYAQNKPDLVIGTIRIEKIDQRYYENTQIISEVKLRITATIKNNSNVGIPNDKNIIVVIIPYWRLYSNPGFGWIEAAGPYQGIWYDAIKGLRAYQEKKISYENWFSIVDTEWKFKVIVDARGSIDETNEDNNEKFSGIFNLSNIVRVRVIGIEMSPSEVIANEDRPTFYVTVLNEENRVIRDVSVRILEPCRITSMGYAAGLIYADAGRFELQPGINRLQIIPCGYQIFIAPDDPMLERYNLVGADRVCVNLGDGAPSLYTPYNIPICEVPGKPNHYKLGPCTLSGSQILPSQPKTIESFSPEPGVIITPMRKALPNSRSN